ncbi:ApcC hetero-tetramer Cut9-Hcn1 [Gigaspora margarita]|uniref:ApcC hetero-tetramer Cut9-Hcn1 n=1 Tax=Gigaspora margarita TaxID=4874 RepID=A0A8H3X1H3_GIGMA|nr:ApcC hetero-tetramer Cut9-Hcn1 [Gigaspora margarita]
MTKRVDILRGKASTMDSHCGPAWVGFGHTFAIESEHDQAITACSTVYPGSHLLTLFIGMQHLQAKNKLPNLYAQSVDSFKNVLKVVEETKNAATSMRNNID